jgi:hypothetical protein
MKHLLPTSMILLLCSATLAQQPSGCQGKEPREVVEKYWRAATRGEFLSKDGWAKQAGFFSGSPSPNSGVIYVISDDWEVGPVTATGNRAQVIVDVEPEGQIDSSLHYTAPSRTDAVKQGTLNRLTCAPTRYTDFKVENNELTPNKTVEGPSAWQLEGSPKDVLATVNAAIRHVLEIQRTTKDPLIRKNADETLSQLLRLH